MGGVTRQYSNIGLLLLTQVLTANYSSWFTQFTQLICGVNGEGVANAKLHDACSTADCFHMIDPTLTTCL